MPRQTGLPAVLKARGLKVELVPGWQTRGNSSFNPRGAVCHWTAGPRGTTGRPSLNIVTYGRPDLNGPLCNVYLDRNGVAVVVAAGRANHAGAGGYRDLSGNSSVFGCEAESAGDNPRSDWTAAQRREYPKVMAAFVDLTSHKDAGRVCGHNEWTPRKIDIRDWDMRRMRSEVNAILRGDEMPITNAEITKIADAVWASRSIPLPGNYKPAAEMQATPEWTARAAIQATWSHAWHANVNAIDANVLADAIVAKLGGSADAAAIKQAVKDALSEGTDDE